MAIGDDLEGFTHLFPQLKRDDGEVTSPQTVFNNCFAYAAGDETNRWEPTAPHVWFTGKRADTLSNYIENYGYVGFEETPSGELEEGYDKIALYVDDDGVPQHAARLESDGVWRSKLGNLEDIGNYRNKCVLVNALLGLPTTHPIQLHIFATA